MLTKNKFKNYRKERKILRNYFRLFDSYRALLVHVREHQRNVGSQEIVHLITQRSFA